MIEHRNLRVEQLRDEEDGSAAYRVRCDDCGWYVVIGGFFGSAKDCPEG